jgi:UDP-glucuronate 4-epimerase
LATILVTGAAGFIGFHLSRRLLSEGHTVVGVDSVNDYYDVRVKQARLAELSAQPLFRFYKEDLVEGKRLREIFAEEQPQTVVNLAAQAGVRYSLENPQAYVDSNIIGFVNILEACRHHGVGHLVYASSSSVYGANTKMPFSEQDRVDHPISMYAATKRANELMAHTYSHLFGLPTTGLRFFTVYGPWGRPDMALFHFTKSILAGKPIDLYNHGKMRRNFTYVDDVVEGIVRLIDLPPKPDPEWNTIMGDPSRSSAPYKIYNVGNTEPVELTKFVQLIEEQLGVKAIINPLPLQLGDVPTTFADVDDLMRDTGYRPRTSIETGIARFIEWYRAYYNE